MYQTSLEKSYLTILNILLIFKIINERLKKLFNNKLSLETNKIIVPKKIEEIYSEIKKYFAIPYKRNISIITVFLIKSKVGFRSLNKISNFVRVHKDQTEHTHKKNIVYKIHCKDCDVSLRRTNQKIIENKSQRTS